MIGGVLRDGSVDNSRHDTRVFLAVRHFISSDA